jgi:hemoglobin
MTTETLYDRLGGEAGIDAVVDEFYDRVLTDDRLGPYFEGVDTDTLHDHQAKFISHVAGGPVEYDGRDMAAAHARLTVTDEDFDRVAEHLEASLRAFDVSADDREELLEAVASLRADIVSA